MCVPLAIPTIRQTDGWASRQAWQTGCRVVPAESSILERKELSRYRCASADRSRVGRERMLTWFVLGLLSPLMAGVLATGRAMGHRDRVCGCSPHPCYSSPPIVSLLSCGIKAWLSAALSRTHLWPGGSPDCRVNGTSCLLNQEQRLSNDNPEHHSNTIGRY